MIDAHNTSIMNDRQRFDQWAETYEHSFMQWLFFDRVHRAVLARIPRGFSPNRILDIGCGTGRLLRRMHLRWPEAKLTGVDSSEGMILRASRLTPYATTYQATAEHLPIEDNSVDLVTSTISFHHWSDQLLGVSEVFRVLRPGGFFVLADTNIGHGHPLSKTQVRQLFQACHLSIFDQANLIPYIAITVGERA